MQAGQLDTLIVIQKRTGGTDAWGTPLPEGWADHCKVWANVRHLSGSESIKAGSDVSVVRASARIRWRTDITAGMRVQAGPDTLDIEAVQNGPRGVYLDLVCKRVT